MAPKETVFARLRDGGAGHPVAIRLATPGDRAGVRQYFGAISLRARYNRFLGAMGTLPEPVLAYFLQAARADRLTILATTRCDGCEIVVGEACYAFDAQAPRVEVALSVHDGWQGRGIGMALLAQLETRAAASGALCVFGDTLLSNDAVIGLARAAGYAPAGRPTDWGQLRFEKQVAAGPQPASAAAGR
ncbi:MAG TPA: GNAT family N-acetyltransferase [Roseomonas sp.]|jgi:GNAT superfamily N-acetyltransferase